MKRYLGKRLLAAAFDLTCIAVAPYIAIFLRFGTLRNLNESLVVYATAFAAGSMAAYWMMRMYTGSWRYVSTDEFAATIKCSVAGVVAGAIAIFIRGDFDGFPRSIVPLSFSTLVMFLMMPRISYRMMREHLLPNLDNTQAERVLVYGFCDAAANFIRQSRKDRNETYLPVGIIAHHDPHVGRTLHNTIVQGNLSNLADIVRAHKSRGQLIGKLIIAHQNLTPAETASIVEKASQAGLKTLRMPGYTDFQDAEASPDIKLQPIVLEDLLGRSSAAIDITGVARIFAGKRVIVTGAGGSIGSEISRQIALFSPEKLILLDNCEFNLYSIDMDISQKFPGVLRTAIIGDVRERETMDQILRQEKPNVVFHAAALKHVPLVEHNVIEAMKTNVLGTKNIADAAVKNGCDAFIMISTDKAVNPTSIMGATKRFAEAYCQTLDQSLRTTRFITVRFGNVLGSAGSVVPLFSQQIAAGGPITVTHPDIERYFMTIPEAVRLVIAASARGLSSTFERGLIFVLDMGKPVKILDLARKMIQLYGLRPDKDIEIKFIGLRPAEKLYEETFSSSEDMKPTENTWLQVATHRSVDEKKINDSIEKIGLAVVARDEKKSILALQPIVPEMNWSRDDASINTLSNLVKLRN